MHMSVGQAYSLAGLPDSLCYRPVMHTIRTYARQCWARRGLTGLLDSLSACPVTHTMTWVSGMGVEYISAWPVIHAMHVSVGQAYRV